MGPQPSYRPKLNDVWIHIFDADDISAPLKIENDSSNSISIQKNEILNEILIFFKLGKKNF